MDKPIKLSSIVSLPLLSAVNAQHESSMQVLKVLKEFGLGNNESKFKDLSFKTKRFVDGKEQEFEITSPILGLINIPSMQIQELTSEFHVRLLEKGGSSGDPLAQVVSANDPNGPVMKMTIKIAKEIPEGLARLNDIVTNQTSVKNK